MKFHEVTVTQVLAGDVGTSLVLAWIDQGKRTEEGLSDVAAGQQTLLFLQRRTSPDAAGIQSQDDSYVTVGYNGVFDVAGDAATARSQNVTALQVADLTRTGPSSSRGATRSWTSPCEPSPPPSGRA